MYKKMLVPVDGSELAEAVIPYSKELAGRLDLDLVFLHVYGPAESEFLPIHRAYVERLAEIARRQSQEVQQRTGIQPGGKAVEARGEVAVGHPAEEILNYADENDIDLILIATHGRSGITRWAIGSVADAVVSASKVPVWLVRAGIPEEIVYDKWPTITMLVPLDGSELAESVLPHVEALAKQRGAELVDVVLVRICESPIIPSYYIYDAILMPKVVQEMEAKYRLAAEQYLAGVEKRLKDVGLRVRSEVFVGSPADTIVDFANTNPFNIIVMATHGRSASTRWVMGSVTDRVVHGVSSPVLIVRPR
ncbi:MAG: universal stress protein [Chloroflexi bacterium]|nr:universal stress protein [Chloroflexota bacterium]